ncbi:MAG: ATP-dependent DNA ligase [Nanoarchaeota archaeon]|nr:ATP-dependent DNA ligase [Nanoarchaeota archaeon]
MIFKELVQLFNQLSSTTKRLKMTEILSSFLKKTKCKDIGFVVLLCMGRIFPTNNEQELGVANNMMIDALALASGTEKREVMKTWKAYGDLGETAKYLMKNKKQVSLLNEELTLESVKDTLYKIPVIEGKGSVDRKLKTISRLLNSAGSDEALFLTRIILGSMRTGVGTGVVRDALSKAFNTSAEEIEKAYNLCTDYSLVAETLCNNPNSIKRLGLKLFNPINLMLYQKVTSVSEGFEKVGKPAIIEVKYDGVRAQIHKKADTIRIFTRNLDEVTKQFPDAVKYVKKGVNADNVIFECEMVAFNPKTNKPMPFQQLSRRVKRKYDIDEIIKEIPVKLFCFDLLMCDGKSLLDNSFEYRHNKLVSIIKQDEHIMMVKGIKTSSEEEANKLFEEGIKEQEGVMFKNLKANYKAGSRVGYGVKLKTHMKELDLVVTEAYYGKGRRSKWFGSFTLSCYDDTTGEFLTVGKLGTGFSDEDLAKMNELVKKNIEEETNTKVVLKPAIVVEVEYEEIQKSPTYSSGYALRFPRLVRFRPDKTPDEANTIKMVEDLL